MKSSELIMLLSVLFSPVLIDAQDSFSRRTAGDFTHQPG